MFTIVDSCGLGFFNIPLMNENLALHVGSVPPSGSFRFRQSRAIPSVTGIKDLDWSCEKQFSVSASAFAVSLNSINGNLVAGVSDDTIRIWNENLQV